MKRPLLAFAVLTIGASLLHAQPAPPAAAPAGPAPTLTPAQAQACSQLRALNASEKTTVQALNSQIKPLAERRKTLVEQNEQRRYDLRNQIVPGSGDALKAFDDKKKAVQEAAQLQIKNMTRPSSPLSVCKPGPSPKLHKKGIPANK